MEEFMFLGLRMVRGISEKNFYEDFGEKIMDVYGSVILENQGKKACWTGKTAGSV